MISPRGLLLARTRPPDCRGYVDTKLTSLFDDPVEDTHPLLLHKYGEHTGEDSLAASVATGTAGTSPGHECGSIRNSWCSGPNKRTGATQEEAWKLSGMRLKFVRVFYLAMESYWMMSGVQ